jgi:GNAT superfamily N-acetyltransferase
VIESLSDAGRNVAALADLLIEATAHGAGVSFLHPLSRAKAEAYWRESLADAARGRRIVLGARDGGRLVGTATLLLAMPENQPHRGEVQKVLVALSHRRHGLGARLMAEVESLAARRGKTLLVLDAVPGRDGARLYERTGWNRVGEIPDFALLPDGVPAPTTIYWKRVGTPAQRQPSSEAGVVESTGRAISPD